MMEQKAVLSLFLVLACFTVAGSANIKDPAKTCSVDDPLDLIFLIDDSIDAGSDVYHKVLDFVAAVISGLDISEKTTKVGVILSDNDTRLTLNLTSNKDLIDQRLRSVPRKSQSSTFWTGGFKADDLLISEGRVGAKRVVVAVKSAEDGGTEYEKVIRIEINGLTASFIVVGVPSAGEKTETNLTKPVNLIYLDNPSSLTESANRIRNLVCEATHCIPDAQVDVMFAISPTKENYTSAADLALQIVDTYIKVGGIYVGVANTDPNSSNQPFEARQLGYLLLKMGPESWNDQSPLQSAVNMISSPNSGRTNGIKVIVFITDHESFKPREDPQSAELAKCKGYTVFTVALNSEKDNNLLRSMASKPEYNLQNGDFSPFWNFVALFEKKGTCKV